MTCVRHFVAAIALLLLVSSVFADDQTLNLTFTDVGSGASQQVTHEDQAPFKGWLTVNVTNNSADPWGDFHFQLIRNLGFGTPSLVVFDDDVYPSVMTGATPYSYTISPDELNTDFYFYTDPVAPGDSASFQLYTDNTDNEQFFGVLMYPTPVPEPAALGLLTLGCALVMFPRR